MSLKKKLSIVLIISLLLTVYAPLLPLHTSVNAAVAGWTINFDNKKSNPVGIIGSVGTTPDGALSLRSGNYEGGSGYNGTAAGRTYAEIVEESTSDQCLGLLLGDDEALNTGIAVAKENINTSDKLVLKANVKLKETAQTKLLDLSGKKASSPTVSIWPKLMEFGSNGVLKVLGGTGIPVQVGRYTAGKWYSIAAIIDIPNGRTEIFIDNTKYTNGIINDFGYLAASTFRLVKTAISTQGGIQIDDLEIYDYKAPQAINITSSAITIKTGESVRLKATVNDAYGSHDGVVQNVTWSVDPNGPVNVDENGVVTLKQGINITETLTVGVTAASVENNLVSGVYELKVTPEHPVESVLITPKFPVIGLNDTLQLNAGVLPENATNKAVSWSSANSGIAAVDSNGVVTGITEGQTQIIATSIDGCKAGAVALTVVTAVVPVQGVAIQGNDSVAKGQSLLLKPVITPGNATNQNVTWSSDNPQAAAVDSNGLVSALSEGKAVITVTTADGSRTASKTITVLPALPISVQSVSIRSTANVVEGDDATLTVRVLPENAANKIVLWSSSDTSIASVDSNGIISALNAGSTVITATTSDGGIKSECVLTVEAKDDTQNEFDILRQKWYNTLTGGQNPDLTIPEVREMVVKTGMAGKAVWGSLIKDANRTCLWKDLPASRANSDWLGNSYVRVKAMAMAYRTKGSSLYGNIELREDIIDSLEWLHNNHFNEKIGWYGNVWHFGIGIQIRMGDMLILMYDYMTPEQKTGYINTLDWFENTLGANEGGANRADVIISKTLQMIVKEDSDRITYYRNEMNPLFRYVTKRDGFYRDGSFVQHGMVAYTGAYGEVLLKDVSNLIYLFDNSTWDVTQNYKDMVIDWMFNSYEPVIYRGSYMDMVRGRSIASGGEAEAATASTLGAFLRASQFADSQTALRIQQMVKYWILSNPDFGYLQCFPTDVIAFAKDILLNDQITPIGDKPEHYEMANMCRSIHKGIDYAFGVSMSSNRILTYELTNGTNGKGWYTGDGMTYLYTNDVNQYAANFWPTVNWYRMPGTTVDTLQRTFTDYQKGDGEGTPTNNWAGGSTFGLYGVSGMNLKQIRTNLEAYKSWFMFDDEVVCLGSDIKSSSGRKIETIVEQRKLKDSGDNPFSVNGIQKSSNLGWNENINNVSWAYLDGNVPDSGVGYYFPVPADLTALRERRTGCWYDINMNTGVSTAPISANYLTMFFDHGINPNGAGYGYVLLPNKTESEVEAYNNNPDIEILENTNSVHAVKEKSLNITAANFFEDTIKTAANLITSNRKASVMIKETPDISLEVAVSDPTFENTGIIELEINKSAAGIISKDSTITVTQLYPTIKMKINVKDANGKTFNAKFDIDPLKPRPEPETAESQILSQPVEPDEAIIGCINTFNSEITGNAPIGWDIDNDADTFAILEKSGSGTNKYIRLFDKNSSGSTEITSHFKPQTHYAEVELQFAEPEGSSGASFKIMSGSNTAVEIKSVNGKLKCVKSDGELATICNISPATWYKVKIAVDLKNGTFNAYVNDRLEAGNIKLLVNNLLTVDALTVSSGYTDTLPLFVDNTVVYYYGGINVVKEKFDGYVSGTKPSGWNINDDKTGTRVYIAEVPNAVNKSLVLDDNNNTFSYSANKTFDKQTGKLTIKWDFMEMATGKWPGFSLCEGARTAIRLQSNGTLKYIRPDNTAENLIAVPSMMWHSIELEVDINNQTFDIYLDGALVKNDAAFYSTVTGIECFKLGTSYGAVDAAIYIDNLDIYKITPVIEGVENGAVYACKAFPVFKTGTGMLSKDGGQAAEFLSGTKITKKGNYSLVVTNAEGNIAAVQFTVNTCDNE